MPLKLNSTGGGSVTLDTPSTASTYTVTIPANTQTLGITSGTAVASTSGTSIDFTSIPSWAKRITVMFSGVSTSGTNILIVQLGTGATPTYTTSGYVGQGTNFNATTLAATQVTTGIPCSGTLVATNTYGGNCVICNVTGNTWNGSSVIGGGASQAQGSHIGGGYIALGAALTAVRITTVGSTDTFDAGSINIMYEG